MSDYWETIQEFNGPVVEVGWPTKAWVPEWTVRVWREAVEATITPSQDDDVSQVIAKYMVVGPSLSEHCKQVAKEIRDLPRVAAVEVKDKYKNGCVLYASEEVEINHRRFTII